MKKTARNLADLEVVSATYDESISKMNVDSLENYSNYRDKLIELVKNSPNLSEAISSGDLTDEDIAGQVDNYLATVPKFSDYYNQFSDLEEWKKKIADVKKAFSDSDWVQDASWSIAEQRINDFNDWFDNLSDEDKEIVYNISCNTDTAKFNLEDWKNALENYSAYTEQTAEEISNNLTKAMESSKSLISNISSVQDALSSQATGKSISIEDFNSDELADYRSALEYTNGTMQLNADKVNEIVKAKADEQIALNNTNKAMAQSKYLENARQIEQYREQLRDARDVLRDMSQDTLSINNPNYSGFDSSKLSGLTDISGILAGISVPNSDSGNSIGEINITIPIDHVEDYEDFVTKLQHDKQFEEMIQSMTVGRMMGGSSLAKYKYRWNKK